MTNIYSPPPFVKAASHEQLYGDHETLPSHLYADPLKKLYPLHSAAATWMSALFLWDKKASLAPNKVEQYERRIREVGDFFSIGGELTKLKEAMAKDEGNDLARLTDAQFALVWQTDLGKERNYPLRNQSEVKAASDWFAQHRDQFVYEDRRQIADKILDRADEFGAAVTDRVGLTKAAGRGTCSTQCIAETLEKRAGMVVASFPDLAGGLRALATSLREQPLTVSDVSTRVKLAATVDQFDRYTKLNRLYGEGGLDRPEEAMFQVTEKDASAFLEEHISTTTGNIYEKSALAKLTLDQVQQWLGTEVADAVSAGGLFVDTEKLADIVTTLPRGDAAMFDRMASAVGIKPFAVEKAAQAVGPEPEEVAGLAELYEQQIADQAVPL